MLKVKVCLVLLIVAVLGTATSASNRYMGYFFVMDQGVDYYSEVKNNSNIMNWEFNAGNLPTVAQRIGQTTKMKLMVTLPFSASSGSTLGINRDVFLNSNGARQNS